MKTVLFACLHNAGRSQMSAAFFNQLADPKKAKAISAGTQPGERVHPEVVEVMKEVGADLSSETPKYLSPGTYLWMGMTCFSSKWILSHSTWYKNRRSRHLIKFHPFEKQ